MEKGKLKIIHRGAQHLNRLCILKKMIYSPHRLDKNRGRSLVSWFYMHDVQE